MKLIKGIACPPGVSEVGVFSSDSPDNEALHNVWGRMDDGAVWTGPMYRSKNEAISKWNSMFSKAVKS